MDSPGIQVNGSWFKAVPNYILPKVCFSSYIAVIKSYVMLPYILMLLLLSITLQIVFYTCYVHSFYAIHLKFDANLTVYKTCPVILY